MKARFSTRYRLPATVFKNESTFEFLSTVGMRITEFEVLLEVMSSR